ncbi:hypothetical protein PHMEG_0009341 [Phytophthora megakarya]|uniref:HTH CENPB-type domain-containing protein n=1 Tax=Phytophthora megakarya TaxID=4795 RepID=A0A225WGF7_9STRA|nr:hypothetical protein PHMEG_0009341 [Phytophthora megakarya]
MTRLSGAGRMTEHLELEERLSDWVVARNSKGIRVMDSYIRLQTKTIYRSLYDDDPEGFRASSGWLDIYKRRKILAFRRQTTLRSLSDEATSICRGVIQRAQHLIEKHHIKSCNVSNVSKGRDTLAQSQHLR